MTSTHHLSMTEEQKVSLKQWNYCTSLIKYMYQVIMFFFHIKYFLIIEFLF